MGEVARGVVLEQRLPDQPLTIGRVEPITTQLVRTARLREPLAPLDRLGARGEASCRQLGCHHASFGRLPGMQRLGHRAEVHLQAARLRRGDAERVGELLGIEVQQTGHPGGGADNANH